MNMAITDGLQLMPPPFADGLGKWSRENGTPGTTSYAGQPDAALVPSDQDFGGCLELQKTETVQRLRHKGETPIRPGLYLRVTARVKAVAGSLPDVRIAAYAAREDGSAVSVPLTAPSVSLTSYGEVVTISAIIGSGNRQGVDLVWGPDPKTMYPPGFASKILTEGPALAGLEDRFRPHFFGGVTTVVGKLFTQVRPDIAIFGEKDFQQLRVVTQMARDLDLGVKVIGIATSRERDGLARSSRNVYLSDEERRAAPALYRSLKETAGRLRDGDKIKAALAGGAKLITAAGFELDYLEARHAETLAPIRSVADGPVRLLVAARIGTTRLIDNIAV